MSSDLAIRFHNVGKEYRVASSAAGGRYTYQSLGERVGGALRHPLRATAAAFSRPPGESFWALRDVSFDVNRGEVIGVIGRNGAGKSTLLKVLSQITRPTTGQIEVHGRVGSLLEVGTGFHPELTGRENVFLNGAILGMTRREIRARFDQIVAFSEVERFLDTPVKQYSSGMYTRLAFAVAAHLDPEVLVVDEVLAVGDAEFQKKCLGKMQDVASGGRTVLFVSHNMSSIASLCTRAVLLECGRVSHAGKVTEVLENYTKGTCESVFMPSTGPISRITATQTGNSITIAAHYSFARPALLPNLGFIVHDILGNPITASSPSRAGMRPLKNGTTKGVVTGELVSPKLLDGKYFLSIYFGDGTTDFVEYKHCLAFEVAAMSSVRTGNARIDGSAIADCSWEVDTQVEGH